MQRLHKPEILDVQPKVDCTFGSEGGYGIHCELLKLAQVRVW